MGIIRERGKWNKETRRAKNVFLMGHKHLDLDALGSCIGAYLILKRKKKKCYLIIDDKQHEPGVQKILRELDGIIEVIKSEDIADYLDPKENKNLLIILDTNNRTLVQSEEVLDKFSKKLIIDHHELGKNTIEDAVMINDNKASSVCEMIASLMEYYDMDVDSYYATALLAGIVLDTNNFTLNTSTETFRITYYLSTLGASAKKVQYLLKQDISEYAEQQKLLSSIETIDDHIAITKGTSNTEYRREDLARVADTLLFFNNIEASFVIGKIGKDEIGLSARSLGNYDIIKILEKLGGGGDSFNGAAKFEETTIDKVEEKLKRIIKEEGE